MLCFVCVVKDVACSTGHSPMLMRPVGERVVGWIGDELDEGAAVPYCTVPVLHLHRTITEP